MLCRLTILVSVKIFRLFLSSLLVFRFVILKSSASAIANALNRVFARVVDVCGKILMKGNA